MNTPSPHKDFPAAVQAPFEFIRRRQVIGEDVQIELKNLDIRTPKEKKLLVENASLSVNQGDHVALIGPNGSGKSSLFRVLRGLTHEGNGSAKITLPPNGEIFVASQEIRKASMILPGLLAYPHNPARYTHEQMEQALSEADLDIAIEHLPRHAVQPDNLVQVLHSDLDVLIEYYLGKLSENSAQSYLKGFEKSLERHFRLPETLEDHFDEDQKSQTVQAISAYLHEHYKKTAQNSDPAKSPAFPEWKGRRHAKAFAQHAVSSIDGWLLQGERMTLSGGQQQRLVFARAFLQAADSDLFLLDEPTSALKGETAHDMIEKLFAKTKGKTVIAIIHDTSLLKHFSHVMELHTDKSLTLTKLHHDHSPAPNTDQLKLDI